jgi:hypothetical protein
MLTYIIILIVIILIVVGLIARAVARLLVPGRDPIGLLGSTPSASSARSWAPSLC